MPGTRSRASIAARMPSSVNVGGSRTSTTRDVGPVLDDRVDERRAVVDGGHDLPAAVAEQARQPLAQQRQVFGDHDAHGSSARIVVPGCAVCDGEPAVERLDALAQAGQPGAGGVGAAVAVVADLELQPVAAVHDAHAAVLGARSAWRRSSAPRPRRSRRPPRSPRAGGRRRSTSSATSTGLRAAIEDSAGPEPAVGEDRGVDAAREVAQLGERALGLAVRAGHERRAPSGSLSSFSCAMPRSIASATSRAWAPSWRSRSIRCSSAAWESTAPARVRSSSTTRRRSLGREQDAARAAPARARSAARQRHGDGEDHEADRDADPRLVERVDVERRRRRRPRRRPPSTTRAAEPARARCPRR